MGRGTACSTIRASCPIAFSAATSLERNAGRFEPEPLDDRRPADRHEHQVGFDALPLAEVDDEMRAEVVHRGALLAEVDVDPPLLERLGELLRGIGVLLRDQRRQHLDDRHGAAEPLEDRGELAADDPSTEHDEPARDLGLCEQPRRVDHLRRVEPGDRWANRGRARGDHGAAERHVLVPLHRERVRTREPSTTLEPFDAVRLEERCDTTRHLSHDPVLPGDRGPEVEHGLARPHAELPEGVARIVQRMGALHPGLRGDAPDPQARAAERGLQLDARHPAAELCRPDRCRVPRWASTEDGDVDFHVLVPFVRWFRCRGAPAS
jgi:hypothetical protein